MTGVRPIPEAQPETLMVWVDWDLALTTPGFPRKVVHGLCARLTCGCFTAPVHGASSQWDFPHEVFYCPTHGQTQLHLMVQAMLMAGDEENIPCENFAVEANGF